MLSYLHGASATPLLGETIGANLRRTVERWPGARRAGGPRAGLPRHLPRAVGPDDAARAGAAGAGDRQGRPRRHLVAQPLRVGGRAVCDRAHRGDPRQRQPGVPRQRARIRAAAVRHPPAAAGPAVPFHRLRGHPGARAKPLPRPGAGRGARRRLGRAARRGRSGRRQGAGRARSGPGLRRPDQHPVHLRHHGRAQGRHAVAPQHPQQRLLLRRDPRLHRSRPRGRAGAVLPLLRHGHRQPRVHHPRRVHRRAGRRVRRRRHAGRRRGGTLHVPLRRPDDVHRPVEPCRLRAHRLLLAAHRRDGRLALPGRGDEAGARPDAHAGDHDLLRHDGDVARVDADARRRPGREARRHGRADPPARGDQDRRPRERPDRVRAGRPASCSPAATA